MLARPYIWRLRSLSLVICPSTCPVLHGSHNAARAAPASFRNPSAKRCSSCSGLALACLQPCIELVVLALAHHLHKPASQGCCLRQRWGEMTGGLAIAGILWRKLVGSTQEQPLGLPRRPGLLRRTLGDRMDTGASLRQGPLTREETDTLVAARKALGTQFLEDGFWPLYILATIVPAGRPDKVRPRSHGGYGADRRSAPCADICERYEDADAAARLSLAGTCPLPRVDAPADTSPVASDAVFSRGQVCAVEADGHGAQESVVPTLMMGWTLAQDLQSSGSWWEEPEMPQPLAPETGQREGLPVRLPARHPDAERGSFAELRPHF